MRKRKAHAIRRSFKHTMLQRQRVSPARPSPVLSGVSRNPGMSSPRENRSQRRMVQRRAQPAPLFVWRAFLDPDFRREERVDSSNKRRRMQTTIHLNTPCSNVCGLRPLFPPPFFPAKAGIQGCRVPEKVVARNGCRKAVHNPHHCSYGAHFWIPTFVGKSELIDLASVGRMQTAILLNTPCSNVCGLRPLFPPPVLSGESRNPGMSAAQSKLKSATDGARLCAIRTLVHIPYISGPRLSPG